MKLFTNLKDLFFLLLIYLFSTLLYAHEPQFMMSHEAPGKGAFDVHGAVLKNTSSREVNPDIEFTWGLTRDFAIKLELPSVVNSENNRAGFDDPEYTLKWRFWDKDSLGQKLALGWALKGNIPVGNNQIGSDNIFLENGVAQGLESLYFYYFVDARYRYNFAANNKSEKPADRLHLDFAPGWRPFVRKLEEIDLVFFLELNYVHFFNGLIENQKTTQDIVSVSPDILLSTSNRLMFRFGVQIPVWKAKVNLAPFGTNIKFTTEYRF